MFTTGEGGNIACEETHYYKNRIKRLTISLNVTQFSKIDCNCTKRVPRYRVAIQLFGLKTFRSLHTLTNLTRC